MDMNTPLGEHVPSYVVRISGTTLAGERINGTGFLVTQRGHVATCRHVVTDSGGNPLAELKVDLPYPYGKPCAYRIRDSSPDDLVILESVVPLGSPTQQAMLHPDWVRDTGPGSEVAVWGYSSREHFTGPQKFQCTISAFSEPNGRLGLSGNINPGDSGAPVVNADQKVIGIVQTRDPQRSGQAMAIPVSLLQPLLSRMDGWRLANVCPGGGPIFLAPKPPVDHNIVGRAPLLKKLKERLTPGGHIVLYFKPGVGKSALAIELANDPEVRARFPGGVLWSSLNRRPNILTELKRWGVALGIAPETMNQLDHLLHQEDLGSGKPPPKTPGPGKAVEEQWVSALTNEIGERSMLLVIDDVWEYEAAQALVLNAPYCAHLITTRYPSKVAKRFGQKFFTMMVEELSDDDGLELMRQLAPNAVDMFPDQVREVVRAVGGLPQGLLLLGTYLAQMSDSKRRRRIEAALNNIQGNLHEYIEPLDAAISTSYYSLPDDETRHALQVLSTFRPKPNTFSEDAAMALLGGSPSVLDVLDDSGLIETVHMTKAQDDPPYTMHRTIAEFVRMKLPEAERHKLHKRAADYYRRWLRQYDEKERSRGDYLYQYRYEEPEWQSAMDDYLYHLGRSGDPMTTGVSFAGIYFDAFWWWGCHTDFPFCTRLLKQASLKRLSPEGQHALNLLSCFDAAYPKETQRTDTEGWIRVETALREIRGLAHLDGKATDFTPEQKHLRAITDIFLAEAYRFGRQDAGQAEHWYLDAKNLLVDSDWSKPWVLYHLSDCYLEMGKLELETGNPERETEKLKLAAEACVAALKLAANGDIPVKERDNEVIANIYRVHAEIAVMRDELERASEYYNFAALYAYAFQAIPSPPDPYTIEFYRLMLGRIGDELKRLHKSKPARALALCQAFLDFWAAYRKIRPAAKPVPTEPDLLQLLEQGRIVELTNRLFPPPATEADMYMPGSSYSNGVITVFNDKAPGTSASDNASLASVACALSAADTSTAKA
jgi:hypothetical protein